VEQLDNLVLPKIFGAFGLDPGKVPFLGVITTLAAILLVGALTRSFIGRAALGLWERLVKRIPIARSMYSILKQFMAAIFGSSGTSNFRRVVLIEYPRRGIFTYAFVTGRVANPPPPLPHDLLKVFIPSTPNPTTGFFLLLSEEETVDTELSVEDAFKLIISAGIAAPDGEITNGGPQRGLLGDGGCSQRRHRSRIPR
jgi:uncharacterized membrane protein